MPVNERILHQFPLSLYCEKTRWNLDSKGLDYRCDDLMPGLHRWTSWRLARQNTLPVLQDGATVVGDSTRIALHLEEKYPERPLLPTDPEARRRALALEDYFDELGVHVRRLVWSKAVGTPEVSSIFFGFNGYAGWQKLLARGTRPMLRQMIRSTFDVYERPVAHSMEQVQAGLERVETLLGGNPDAWLQGHDFGLVDLTAAAMLAPLVGPENSPWASSRLPPVGVEERKLLWDTVAGQWVLRVYREQRAPRR